MKKSTLKFLISIALLTILGCEKGSDNSIIENSESSEMELLLDENYVNFDEALIIGKKLSIATKDNDVTGKGDSSSPKTISSLQGITNKN